MEKSKILYFGANLNEQIQSFTEDREFLPVLVRTTNGNEHTATLHDLTKPLRENLVSRIFSDARSDRIALEEALNQHYSDLQQDRNAIQHFVKAITDLAGSYRKQIARPTPSRSLNGGVFTESESLALRLPFNSSDPSSPATAGFRRDMPTANDPTQSRTIKDLMASTRQPSLASQLEQLQQAIDHVAAQNSTGNETVIETGLAESESAASESLAILI